ncbi:hypothetical protein [Paenibacillus wynnii]|uniref:Choloylglycine hydrolase/NAAA C-terminal domain-containing protein n=1 Tax=Paenibacillus wynnii TaxID=268407 RepID=A0A098M5J4_9BACL|nr:hypothetical protein [Paenibacillus wynnii]KGE16827.1 hypothetical protein PWYN_19245 [Paenibacillus wynnii]
MCTSFVVHLDKTYIGMNFDISSRPIKIVLVGENQLQVQQKENGQFYPAFGMNAKGTFMNLLMVEPNEEGKYRRGKNCIHMMKLFDDVLSERIALPQLNEYLENNTIVNVPNQSVHSLIAGKRESYIVEPGRQKLDLDSVNQDFMVLTNFPVTDESRAEYKDASGPGNDRYIKVHEMITNHIGPFNIEAGFKWLMETVQHDGDYPTQFSMIFIPEERKVYFTLNADFEKVFEFFFNTKEIQSLKGFTNHTTWTLSNKGILLSELVKTL